MSGPPRASRRLGIALTLLGSFLVSMDVSVVNAIQPAISASFHGVGTVGISWTITAYAITFAAVLVPAGRVADRAGRRRTFVAGLCVFAAGSLVCGAAPDLAVLLAGRVIQAAGAAAAQPASVGLLLVITPARLRSPYAARWGAAGAVGVALGPVVGGALATAASWRWAFLIVVPIVAVACPLASAVLPETERHSGRRLPDPPGAATLAAAAVLLTLGISQLGRWGATDGRTLACLIGSGLLWAWFVGRCRRVADPLLALELLRDRQVALLTLTTALYAASFFGLLFSFVLFETGVWRMSVVEAGLGITPMAAVVVALSPVVGRLPGRFGFGRPLAAGAAVMAVGLLLDVLLARGRSFHAAWIAVATLIGVGIALCYLLLAAAAVDGRPAGELAGVTAINQCARQLGAAIGVAATAAAIGARAGAAAGPFHVAWLICAAFAAGAALTASALRKPSGRAAQLRR